MRIAHTITGAPIGLDAAPTAVEPPPSRVFPVPLRGGLRNGLPFSLLSLLSDGTSIRFSVWVRITELVSTWYQIDATQLAFPNAVNTVRGVPPEADIFIQVVAVGGAPTRVMFALTEQAKGVPGDSPKDLVSGVILQLNPDNPNVHVAGLGIDYLPNEATGATVHATQAVDADRPALGTGGLGGHRYAEFDLANTEHMVLTGITDASNDYTVFAVVDQTTIAGHQCVFSAVGGTTLTAHATLSGANVAAYVGNWETGQAAKTGAQVLSWVVDKSAGNEVTFYREGIKLAVSSALAAVTIGGTVLIGANAGPGQHLNADLYYLVVVNRKCTDAEVATINAWLMQRFVLTASMASIADWAASWDLDYSTQAGGVLTGLTDLALGGTLNIAGSPAIVTVDGRDFVRMDGTDDVIWMADKAALDGAAGCTYVLTHANCEALPANVTFCQKGQHGLHINGGVTGFLSAGTRFTAEGNSGRVVDSGPLAEFTSPAETIAMAFESGAAVRRVDGDGTYASTVTAVTTAVGAGALTWGAREGVGAGVFSTHAEIDYRRADYFSRPLNQYELIAAHAMAAAL